MSDIQFTNQQIVAMLTYISGISYSTFVKEYLPHIKSFEHFRLTVSIYNLNPKYTWEQAASIAAR